MGAREGQRIGNYQLLRLLGQGGQASVYLGEHIHNKTLAAVKVLQTHLINQKEFKEFINEARTSRLQHPNIVPLLDFGFEDDIPFLVMDYASNGNLRRQCSGGMPLAPERILAYVKQIASALQYAHDQKLIHRDVKPENMLVGPNGEIWLSDFGISVVAHTTVSQPLYENIGTLPYMAPEQLYGKPCLASDQYALGIVVYEWLCGELPFQGSPVSLALQHDQAVPPPLRAKVPTLSLSVASAVESVVFTALAKDPKERFASITAFANALERALLLSEQPPTGRIPAYLSLTGVPVSSSFMQVSAKPALTQEPVGSSLPTHINNLSRKRLLPMPELSLPSRISAQSPLEQVPASSSVTQVPVNSFLFPLANHMPMNLFRKYRLSWPLPLSHFPTIHVSRRVLFILALVLIVPSLVVTLLLRYSLPSQPACSPAAPTLACPPVGPGVFKAPDGEPIGISDGTFAFDTHLPQGGLKQLAAQSLKDGDLNKAEQLWQPESEINTNDAETLIYLEDQRVLASHHPYITLVVATTLTGDHTSAGRDQLQGAYVAQKEFNSSLQTHGVQLRLLIASSGSQPAYAAAIAKQILQLAQRDKTLAGVMGWPFSADSEYAISELDKDRGFLALPLVSPTSPSISLAGKSLYFFHVAPVDASQGQFGAQYAEHTLGAKRVVLFEDPADSYSADLAQAFLKQFTSDGNNIVAIEPYTAGKPESAAAVLPQALSYKPDLIYFTGSSCDINSLLVALPASGPQATLQIMGGDMLYDLGCYSPGAAGFNHLHFTAMAYPDEWDAMGLTAQKPAFFIDYSRDFDPQRQHTGTYSYDRSDSAAMLSYDAMSTLLSASTAVLQNHKTSVSPGDLWQALTNITVSRPIQSVSGQISFSPNGAPIDKAMVVLCVNASRHIHIQAVQGRFLMDGPLETRTFSTECN